MEIMSVENSAAETLSSNDVGHQAENPESQLLNHGDAETKPEITEEEVNSILEIIAATGKFWHDWDTLKTLLSFRLKQVLAEYPESQMVSDQQSSSLGKTYADLVKRLDEALLSFTEGPPFTLQRLCEILLTARSLYPNLSKLDLALEKNLLVTSTLTISTDPYPSPIIKNLDGPNKGSMESVTLSPPLQNGVEAASANKDEEMADKDEEMVEAEDIVVAKDIAEDKVGGDKVDEDGKDINNDGAGEEVDRISEINSSAQTNISEPSGESSPANEHFSSSEQLNSASQ